MTDKSSAFLNLSYGIQHQEGTVGEANLAMGRVGMETKGTEKLRYKVAAGIERYVRPQESLDEGDDAFSFEASADWFATEKWTFRCGGQNGTQLSSFYSGNGLDFISGWVGAGYRWSPSTTYSARGIYRTDDYLDPVSNGGVMIDRKDERVEGHIRVDYTE